MNINAEEFDFLKFNIFMMDDLHNLISIVVHFKKLILEVT